MSITVLETRNLSAGYNNNPVIDQINLDVREGELLGLLGPNGAGKTTLFRAVLGLQNYTGTIKLFGQEGSRRNKLLPLIGYVPQKMMFETNFPATVYDIVSMGIVSESKLVAGARLIQECNCCWNRVYKNIKSNDEKVMRAIATVGLESVRDRRIGELSGGEMQRVFIAKSLVRDPLLLILDEPVNSVDVESQAKFYDLITKINRENRITIIWSSHDLDAISKHASRVACMNKRLFFHGKKEDFFLNNDLLKTYTESSMQMHMRHHGSHHG